MDNGVSDVLRSRLKVLVAWCLRLAYRVEAKGLGYLVAREGKPTVVVVNHVSFLDAVLLAAFMPGRPMFAIDSFIARRWWMRPFLPLVEAYAVDPTSPMSTRALIRRVRQGQTCVIFPEGRITMTGTIMKVYEGPAVIAAQAGAEIVPLRIDGAQFTPFSRLRGRVRVHWFPKVTLTALPPQRFEAPAGGTRRERRHRIGAALYDVMTDLVFETSNRRRTLFQAFLDARRLNGGATIVAEDIDRRPLTADRLLAGSVALGRTLARRTQTGEAVGVLLPNSIGVVVTFFALQALGRVPAMLNFTAGLANLSAACRAARVRTVLTSRRFLEQARLQSLADGLAADFEVSFLEDLRGEISIADKAYGLAGRFFAERIHQRQDAGPDAPAVVLFTSGTEGPPKGVVLSHANILANCFQLSACVDFTPADRVFNALPVFHAFGLMGGLILPTISGIRTFLYPSPLHYRIVPELVYDTNATIFFGVDTFLAGYGRVAHPYDFYSVRYVFAGAEKVRDETRRTWFEKFGIRILEGYGTTETAPVLAINTPMMFKSGTVGRLLPGIAHRLEPVPGIAEGGRLWVNGPNVMLGYLMADRPGELLPPPGGWYDTGDVVGMDETGYLSIIGRAKRFAKVGGEMVSLGQVETETAALWPGHQHAVIAVPDARKGERLVLLTSMPDANATALAAQFRSRGLPEFAVPKTVLVTEKLPLLGSGKVDYTAVKAIVENVLAGKKQLAEPASDLGAVGR